MLRLRSKSPLVLFGAFVAASMLGSPSFADTGGGNASQIPIVVSGAHVEHAQAMLRAPLNTVPTSNACKGGFRYIHRNPNPENDSNREFSVPLACN